MRRQTMCVAVMIVLGAVNSPAQKMAPADLAAALSGSWKLNQELSPSLAAPGRGDGRGRSSSPLFAVAVAAPQRGGGRGGGGRGEGGGTESSTELMAEEKAAQSALRVLQQVPLVVTIAATATDVKFTDPRGEWSYKVDDKTRTMDVPGGKITVKSKWDRATLRQEFSTTQRKLVKSWSIDANSHLVLAERVESMTVNTTESKAVFDRQD